MSPELAHSFNPHWKLPLGVYCLVLPRGGPQPRRPTICHLQVGKPEKSVVQRPANQGANGISSDLSLKAWETGALISKGRSR